MCNFVIIKVRSLQLLVDAGFGITWELCFWLAVGPFAGFGITWEWYFWLAVGPFPEKFN